MFSWCRIGQVPMDARGTKIPHGIATKIIGHLANRNNVIHNNNLRCLQLLNYVTWEGTFRAIHWSPKRLPFIKPLGQLLDLTMMYNLCCSSSCPSLMPKLRHSLVIGPAGRVLMLSLVGPPMDTIVPSGRFWYDRWTQSLRVRVSYVAVPSPYVLEDPHAEPIWALFNLIL